MKGRVVIEAARVQRLEPPTHPARVVLDTDAANEIDDQFAIAYAVLSAEHLSVEAVYAAPFQRLGPAEPDLTSPTAGVFPGEGMEQSYQEIVRVLNALPSANLDNSIHRGAESWLTDAETPVTSPAAEDLIARVRTQAAGPDPLYVVALGAPTNVASALLAAPEIAEQVVVIWLGGNGTWWIPGAEYNVYQDRHASRVLLDCGVPLVHVPCYQVTEKLMTTQAEVERVVRGRGRIGNYLADLYQGFDHGGARMKQLWDIGPIAWLINPNWCPSALVHSPVLQDDLTWGFDPTRHLIREVRDIDADAVLGDLFAKLPTE
jgi:purine nucleosidase